MTDNHSIVGPSAHRPRRHNHVFLYPAPHHPAGDHPPGADSGAYLLEFRLITQVLDFWHGYPDFLQRIAAGDFGLSSVSGQPVLDEIRHYFPATLTLCLAAFAISLLVGIPLGTLAALYQGAARTSPSWPPASSAMPSRSSGWGC